MQVIINDTNYETQTKFLAELIQELQIIDKKEGIAIAINGQLITRNNWPVHELKKNDRIEIVQAFQGG